jgi:hypothetical protein
MCRDHGSPSVALSERSDSCGELFRHSAKVRAAMPVQRSDGGSLQRKPNRLLFIRSARSAWSHALRGCTDILVVAFAITVLGGCADRVERPVVQQSQAHGVPSANTRVENDAAASPHRIQGTLAVLRELIDVSGADLDLSVCESSGVEPIAVADSLRRWLYRDPPKLLPCKSNIRPRYGLVWVTAATCVAK